MTVSGSVTKSGLEKVISQAQTKGSKVPVGEGTCFAFYLVAGEA